MLARRPFDTFAIFIMRTLSINHTWWNHPVAKPQKGKLFVCFPIGICLSKEQIIKGN